jgi:hypothetical protein
MQNNTSRLILPEDLPESLWYEGKLCLPPDLTNVWLWLLDKCSLRSLAEQPCPKKGPTGGITQQATNEHLAWRFTTSAARVELAMLDPHSNLPQVANAFARIFSGGRIAVIDVPCGSGAAILSILTTVAELRRQECLPRIPLEVVIIGGEISESARQYADDGIQYVCDTLAKQAITIEYCNILSWHVCDKWKNTDLIQEVTLKTQNCRAMMLVIANFSGFLQTTNNWKEANPQIEELFRHCKGVNNLAIWIEPQTNKVTVPGSGFFSRLIKWFKDKLRYFVHSEQKENEPEVISKDEVNVIDPLRPKEHFTVHLAVIRFDLQVKQ